MVDVNIGQTPAAVWESVIGSKPTDNIFTSRGLFYFLGDKGFKESSDGGRLIEFSLMYAENTTFRSYAETEDLDITRIDVFDAARFDWKVNAGTVVFSALEQARASGSNQKFDLSAEKLENGKDSHIAALNRQMWSDGTGNGGKDIGGVQLLIAIAPTTGTVGGINRATWSFYRNRQNSGAKTSTAYDNLRSSMRTTYNQCSDGGVENAPTAWGTDRTTFEGYTSLLVANERYAKDGSKDRGGDAGFDNNALMFMGAKGFYDEDAPAGEIRFFNPKFLKLVYLKGMWMKMFDSVEPANSLTSVHKVATFANMGTNCPRRLGVVSAIT